MKVIKRAAVALTGIAVLGVANAKEVEFCNGSPMSAYAAVAMDQGQGAQTHGWYRLEPQECVTFRAIVGSRFEYFANSAEDLARWLGQGRLVSWSGWRSRCIDPSEPFTLPAEGQCQKRAGFIGVNLLHEQSRVVLYEKNHRGIPLEEATELRRRLIGRMEFEQSLRRQAGREPPFQLGLFVENARAGGVRITRVFPGMPAETEGLAVGDRIVALDGYQVSNTEDLANILDDIDILRTDSPQITVVRNGVEIAGTIAPMFYEWNHRDYEPSGAVSTFLWSGINGVFAGFGNGLACATVVGLAESMEAVADDRDFSGKRFMGDTGDCSKGLDRDLAKRELLYPTATSTAFWASLVVPEGAALKATRVARAVPLAGRSRYVVKKL